MAAARPPLQLVKTIARYDPDRPDGQLNQSSAFNRLCHAMTYIYIYIMSPGFGRNAEFHAMHVEFAVLKQQHCILKTVASSGRASQSAHVAMLLTCRNDASQAIHTCRRNHIPP